MQCRKLAKTVDKLAETLENLQNPIGPRVQVPRRIRRPASWNLAIPKRCPEKPRRLTTRLLPRGTSF
jgi:hypothetical protein